MARWLMLYSVLFFVILSNFIGTNKTLAQVAPPEAEGVSLVQLIANPSAYQGKLVRVIGFCRLEFEGDALFLHREDFEQGLTKNALWLDVESPIPERIQKLSDGYVLVEAIFDAEHKGHMGLFSGSLKVKGMEHWRSRKEYEQMRPVPQK